MSSLPATFAAPGRNAPCPCGSSRKYKHCCMLTASPAPRTAAPHQLFAMHMAQAASLIQSGSVHDLQQACISLHAANQLRPNLPGPVNDLGVVLARLHQPEPALICYRQALQLDPCHAPALSNLGMLYHSLGRHPEAIASLTAALDSRPGFTDAHINLSAALNSAGLFDEAVHHARAALAQLPDDLEAQLNLGNAFKHQGRYTRAAAVYERAAASPAAAADSRPWNNLGETRRDQGRIPEAVRAYTHALALEPANSTAWSNLLYLHAFAHDLEPASELALARNWELAVLTPAQRAEARHAASSTSGVFSALPLTGRRLRLGIVSAELGTHAVAEFLQPFLEHLDRDRFHLTLFSTDGRHDDRAAQLRSLADDFVPLHNLADDHALRLLRSRSIDVLIDTSGHTSGNRLALFARRAAPVQCTWIGYWNSTGLSEMDYFLADPIAPSDAQSRFSETLWRLPRINVAYRGDPTLPIDWQPSADGVLHLGSLNKFAKIREESIALWAGALHALPHARLVLEDRGSDDSDSHLRIRSNFATHGIASDRIEFLTYVPGHRHHMELYNHIDIALDTLPFNSGTTAFDTLWMGVPLVTLEGDWTGGRIAAGVLRALGHPEWVASDPARFTTIVCGLARNLDLRRRLRHTLRGRITASSLCDAQGLARALEDAFTTMYHRWLEGQHTPT